MYEYRVLCWWISAEMKQSPDVLEIRWVWHFTSPSSENNRKHVYISSRHLEILIESHSVLSSGSRLLCRRDSYLPACDMTTSFCMYAPSRSQSQRTYRWEVNLLYKKCRSRALRAYLRSWPCGGRRRMERPPVVIASTTLVLRTYIRSWFHRSRRSTERSSCCTVDITPERRAYFQSRFHQDRWGTERSSCCIVDLSSELRVTIDFVLILTPFYQWDTHVGAWLLGVEPTVMPSIVNVFEWSATIERFSWKKWTRILRYVYTNALFTTLAVETFLWEKRHLIGTVYTRSTVIPFFRTFAAERYAQGGENITLQCAPAVKFQSDLLPIDHWKTTGVMNLFN